VLQPSLRTVQKLLTALQGEPSLDAIERCMGQDAVLAWRFLRYANSAAVVLPHPVESLRHGLMGLGYAMLKQFLQSLLPKASTDLDLEPLRLEAYTQARMMQNLLQTGEESELRREVFWCGLLSHLPRLLDTPHADLLQGLPVVGRVSRAVLSHAGPYSALLDVAAALALMPQPQAQASAWTGLAPFSAGGAVPAERNTALLITLRQVLEETQAQPILPGARATAPRIERELLAA
jgi:c-di-GMP phosphodiesterase